MRKERVPSAPIAPIAITPIAITLIAIVHKQSEKIVKWEGD